MSESETIITKFQFEVDNSVNALFPEDQEEIIKHLKENNRKLKEKLKNRRERKWKKFTNRPNYGYYSPKVDPPHQQVLISSPKEVVAANDLSSLHRNVTAFHSNLKFTYGTSSCTDDFLDLNVSLRNGAIHTDLYIKPADDHQYLHYQSSHPLHIKNSIPYNRALRVSRIFSSEKDFKTHVFHMKEWFLARGYPDIVVNNQIDKVVFGRDQSVKKNLESGIPFVTTYHPKVKELGKMIRDLLPFLYSDGEVQKVFSPPPIGICN